MPDYVVNGIQPLEPLVNADGEEVSRHRTYGDAYEGAVRYMAEAGDTRTLTWGHCRFEVELSEPPIDPPATEIPVLLSAEQQDGDGDYDVRSLFGVGNTPAPAPVDELQPLSIFVAAAGDEQATLTMNVGNNPTATGIIIQRALSVGGPWTDIQTNLPTTTTTFTNTGLTNDTQYFYRGAARNGAVIGPYSPAQPVTPRAPSESALDFTGVHTSLWQYDGIDSGEVGDFRYTGLNPYGCWVWVRLNQRTTGYRPDVLINGTVFTPVRDAGPGAENLGTARTVGSAGSWVGPIMLYHLNPETTYTLRVRQPDGTWSAEGTITTRAAINMNTADFMLSAATEAAIDLTEASAWASDVSTMTVGGSGDQPTVRSASAALYWHLTGNRLAEAIGFWDLAIQRRSGTDSTGGSDHRYRGPYAWQATYLLRNELTPTQLTNAFTQLIDDLEANAIPRNDDSDKWDSDIRTGMYGSIAGLRAIPAGETALIARYQAIYDYYIRRLFGVLYPQARTNDRFGTAGGWPLDGSDYGRASLRYMMESFWLLENVAPTESAKYAPFYRNVAHQICHMDLPDFSAMFTFGDMEDSDTDATTGLMNISSMDATCIVVAYLCNKYGHSAEANHLYHRMAQLGTENIAEWRFHTFRAMRNSALAGAGRCNRVYVNHSGSSAAVFARTGWTTADAAMMHSFGWGGAHHGQADAGQIEWAVGSQVQLNEIAGYYDRFSGGWFLSDKHNVPAGQRVRHAAGDGGALLTEFSFDGTVLNTTLFMDEPYTQSGISGSGGLANAVTRSVTYNMSGEVITVTDTGVNVPETTPWHGPAAAGIVQSNPDANTRIYTITPV